jgi:branched-chain amino acid transport system permease protein
MMTVIQVLINGLILGGLYICIASGMSLVWGVMNLINITHGALAMLGSYVTFWLFNLWGVDPFLSIPLSMGALFVFGYALQKYFINLIIKAPIFMTMIFTWGIELMIVNMALYFWSADFRAIDMPYSAIGISLGGINIPYYRLAFIVIAFALGIGLLLFMDYTWIGRAIRATRMDMGVAELMGVRVDKIYAITFGVGACLAGASGSLIAMAFPISPTMGGAYLFKALVVCVIGGLGDIRGAIIGGLIFGLVETIGSLIFGSTFIDVIAFGTLVLVIIFVPRGIFGKEYY